jgi:PAS domain S-box-containing protein
VTPLQQLQYKGAIVVPLLARGKLLGTLTVARMPGNPYTTDDIGLMTACANQIAVAMENANLYAQILQRKAHLQSILDVSRDGIIVSTAHHLIFRNEAASTIFGYPHTEDVTGIDTINFFAPESREILEDIRHRLDAGEQITETIKFKGKKRDNTTFDAEARVASFLENGQRFVVTVIRDVTQRNQMEFQLQQANKLAAIGELAAGIAHEINNPIATIEIQAGRLRDAIEDEHDGINGDFQNRLEECISQVEAQVQRCQAVTNNLLSFSRTSEIKQEQCEINHILQNTITLVTSLTHKKPTIQTSLDNNLPFFYGDPRRLEQVFVNVLNNALKAIRNDGTISVDTCVDNNNDIKIRFADSGPGIPKALLARIFDPFFTTSPEGEGTGLGLSITHFIIKEMDGKIDVESTPGQGTTFTITLPGDEKRKENIPHVT